MPKSFTKRFASPQFLSAVALTAALTCLTTPAFASEDAYAQIKQALTTGQTQEALRLVKEGQDKYPRDVQLMFFEGVINAQLGEERAATAIFERMAKDYPELPEPHNNLGVLYAARGDLVKAKTAFERAIFTNPSYATAHQNVADVYSALARKNYGQALQVDGAAQSAPTQMTLLGSLGSKLVGRTGNAPVVVLKTPDTQVAAAEPVKQATPPAASSAAVTPAPAPIVAPATIAASAPAVVAVDTSAIDEVESALANWAKAWSDRDTKAYLNAYATTFKASNGKSRTAWEAERISRIEPRKRISVKLSNVRVTVQGDTASARMSQRYESDSFNGTSPKRMNFVKENNQWRITRETVE